MKHVLFKGTLLIGEWETTCRFSFFTPFASNTILFKILLVLKLIIPLNFWQNHFLRVGLVNQCLNVSVRLEYELSDSSFIDFFHLNRLFAFSVQFILHFFEPRFRVIRIMITSAAGTILVSFTSMLLTS